MTSTTTHKDTYGIAVVFCFVSQGIQFYFDVIDRDHGSESDLVDSFVINITTPSSRHDLMGYDGIFGIAHATLSFEVVCLDGGVAVECDFNEEEACTRGQDGKFTCETTYTDTTPRRTSPPRTRQVPEENTAEQTATTTTTTTTQIPITEATPSIAKTVSQILIGISVAGTSSDGADDIDSNAADASTEESNRSGMVAGAVIGSIAAFAIITAIAVCLMVLLLRQRATAAPKGMLNPRVIIYYFCDGLLDGMSSVENEGREIVLEAPYIRNRDGALENPIYAVPRQPSREEEEEEEEDEERELDNPIYGLAD